MNSRGRKLINLALAELTNHLTVSESPSVSSVNDMDAVQPNRTEKLAYTSLSGIQDDTNVADFDQAVQNRAEFIEDDHESESEPFGENSDEDPDFIPIDKVTNSSSDEETTETTVKEVSKKDKNKTGKKNDVAIDNDQESVHKDCRKRMRNEAEWEVTKRKNATLAGKKHISKSGKNIAAKQIKPSCGPCKKKCSDKINEVQRLEIFNNYWNENTSWDHKRQFVVSRVKSSPIKRKRPANGINGDQRKQSIRYTFQVEGNVVNVCKVFFLNTIGISETVVKNALKKSQTGGFTSQDMRGRHEPKNKLSENIKNQVCAHIQSFPIYESHYSRNQTKKKYLGSELNIEKMYNLYQIKCEEDGLQRSDIAKSWFYRHIFKTNFNLGFKLPSNDTCDMCDSLHRTLQEQKSEEERIITQEKIKCHLKDAETRYSSKKNDKVNSPENTTVIMLDLQKCLPTPHLSNAKSFYSLKLWTLNLTIYDATKKKAYCMVWDESVAGRGGHEIASALLKWANDFLRNSNTETLIIWSDNCPSQNRNIMMAVNYFYLLNICPSLKCVTHKFLLRGHTHMEADHVHALIERSIKKQPTMTIATPWDWQQLIRSTGANVISMEVTDFKNFDVLYATTNSPFVNRKINTDKNSFLISSAIWLEVRRENPAVLYYKTSFNDEEYKSVDLNRTTRKKLSIPDELPPIRKTSKGIPAKKKQHLLNLLEWIPSQFHNFYENMKISNQEVESDSD